MISWERFTTKVPRARRQKEFIARQNAAGQCGAGRKRIDTQDCVMNNRSTNDRISRPSAPSNRHYFCGSCGGVKRAAAILRLPAQSYPANWPRCCNRLMQALDYEQAAAIVKLTPTRRLRWSMLGQHIYRGRRKGIWKPAMTDHDVRRAQDDFASFTRKRLGPPTRAAGRRGN